MAEDGSWPAVEFIFDAQFKQSAVSKESLDLLRAHPAGAGAGISASPVKFTPIALRTWLDPPSPPAK